MTLPHASPKRRLMHRRQIDLQVFLREDSMWEVDARITDVKSYDWMLKTGLRPAGTPIHDMTLRIVVDRMFNIVDAGAQTDWMPYPGQCSAYGDAYRRLIGLNLLHRFRAGLKERLGGVLGCTHITELAQTLPTVIIQAYAGLDNVAEAEGSEHKPMQIDRCHALSSEGEVVRVHYPRWYKAPSGTAGTT